MTKRWKYRKVTPENRKNMKDLREKGWSYVKIGKLFNIDPHSVRYWIDEEYRQRCIKRAKSRKRKPLTDEQKTKRKVYIRKYIKKRYNEDPEFRERFLGHTKKWQRKNKAMNKVGSEKNA